ncbi:hypothetical protein QWY90_14980 [Flavobacterium paronense]|uniref:DUF4476 domain-containing protein n=1 Tax=Flavobacterium paronense TaxID=1392775 RepID=A0ABV5GGS0_9FLAO|nr:hypothetical protein [Flavobacterium paronense]MDN3678617.1 hypothetical protein [Flavobacterium paronense]
MKKRLESELISIAHRILKLKNKSEVDQLYKETQKLYETLAVLKFYQDNFESVKSDVTPAVLEEKLEQSLEVETISEPVVEVKEDSSDSEQAKQIVEPIAEIVTETEVISEPEEEIIVSEEPEEVLEEEESIEEAPVIEEALSFQPIFELEAEEEEDSSDSELAEQIEPAETASEVKPEEKLEDHIGKYSDPVFVKPNEVSLFESDSSNSELEKQREEEAPKTTSINESQSKSIAIGLNDRIGFVQHLFNDSNEDFNRVISQLNTFDTFEEAKNFINEMVIPDYDYWVGEEDYIERFMAIVEKKFQ